MASGASCYLCYDAVAMKKRKKRGITVGVAPGTLQVDRDALPSVLTALAYDTTRFVEIQLKNAAEIPQLRRDWPNVWVNVDGLGNAATLQAVGDIFGLHPLALEDVVNVQQRPKVENYEHCVFVVLRMVILGEQSDQMSLFFGKDFVLTFQERPGDCFNNVRSWLRKADTPVRKRKVDFLAYSLIDALIDHYFPLLETLGEQVEDLQTDVIMRPDSSMVVSITRIKRDLLRMRRAIWPLRDELSVMTRNGAFLNGDTSTYLRDCYDHTLLLIDTVETLRDITNSLMDAYLSAVNNRMNEIMKTLTIIATIFIPLTFVAGVYGMNFNAAVSPYNMPELNWYWGYPAAWALMGFVGLASTGFMWHKGWFRSMTPNPRAAAPKASKKQ